MTDTRRNENMYATYATIDMRTENVIHTEPSQPEMPDTPSKWIQGVRWWLMRMSFLENASEMFEENAKGFIDGNDMNDTQKNVFLSDFFHVDDSIRPHVVRKNAAWKLKELNHLYLELFKHPNSTPMTQVLCATFLLRATHDQQPSITTQVIEMLMTIFYDDTIPMNIKWDVYDVIMGLRHHGYRHAHVFHALHEWADDNRWMQPPQPQEIIEREHHAGAVIPHSTVYNDNQNVHNTAINTSIKESLQILSREYAQDKDRIESFEEACHEIATNLVVVCTTRQYALISQTLHRFRIDKSLIPINDHKNVGMRDVLLYVWNYIRHCEDETRMELVKRLSEELQEANGTCSSGHVGRVMNVLSGFHEKVGVRIGRDDHIRVILLDIIQNLIIDHDDLQDELINPSPRGPLVRFLFSKRSIIMKTMKERMQERVDVGDVNRIIQKIFPSIKPTQPLREWWGGCPRW